MVGILTFYWADNYGAMLQTYALRRHLEKLGEQVRVIPYAPYKLTSSYWLVPFNAKMEDGTLRYRFQRYTARQNVQMLRRFEARRFCMRAFRRRYLTSALPIRKAKNISLQPYKCVFIGSDQVWNPEITMGLDDAYIGNIPQCGNCRLISYGASFGGASLSEADQEKFIRYVSGFDAVSVREKAGAVLAQQLLGRKVYHVLDPTLLLERAEWEEIQKIPLERDYILLYMMPYKESLLHYAQTFAARLGKKLIAFSNPANAYHIRDIEPNSGVGPSEFIGYIQNAYCVLTNSFHGTVFSILFEKPFLTYCHDPRGGRPRNLLERLGLLSHMLEIDKDTDFMEIWAHTDWEQVKLRLAERREQSKQFIAEHI